jgi:hypothetical protein
MTDKIILKSLDGTVVARDMTTEEQATQDAFKQSCEDRKVKIQNHMDKQASGKQKLLDIGLTEEEVQSLINV